MVNEAKQKTSLIISFLLFVQVGLNGQTIKLESVQHANSEVILAYEYSDGIYTLKKQYSNEEGGVLFYNDSLKTGIYYLLLPDSNNFEFLYDENFPGKISIMFDKDGNVSMVNAPTPTELYYKYRNALNSFNGEKNDLLIDSLLLMDNNSFASKVLKCFKSIDIPDLREDEGHVLTDSSKLYYRTNYYQKHYLDNIDLADERLIYTSIYTQKINDFIDRYTAQNVQSLNASVNYVIKQASSNSVAYEFVCKYLLEKLNRKKHSPIYERVYLNFIKNYFLDSHPSWLNDKQLASLTREYNRHYPSSLGQISPNVKGYDINDKVLSLQDVPNNYVILYFYDYDCPICKKVIPYIKKIMDTYDYLNVEVVSICLGPDRDKWLSYLQHQRLSAWQNIFANSNAADVSIAFNLSYTPTIFLLNKDREIIGKSLTAKQLENLLLEEALKANR